MSTKKHDVLRNQIDDNYAGYCNGRRNKWSIATFFRHNTRRTCFIARYLRVMPSRLLVEIYPRPRTI